MDIALIALASTLLGATGATVEPPAGPVLPAPRITAVASGPRARAPRGAVPADTVIEYSKAYYQRLTIHRWASYTILPLFAAQYYVGSQLYSGSGDGNKDVHEMLAAGVAGLFAVNTATGLWNLYDMRADPNGRARRITHVTLMLLADAGFVATGLLADESEDGGGGAGNGASTHRTVAISSMAVSTIGWLIMTDLFRKD